MTSGALSMRTLSMGSYLRYRSVQSLGNLVHGKCLPPSPWQVSKLVGECVFESVCVCLCVCITI